MVAISEIMRCLIGCFAMASDVRTVSVRVLITSLSVLFVTASVMVTFSVRLRSLVACTVILVSSSEIVTV